MNMHGDHDLEVYMFPMVYVDVVRIMRLHVLM